MKWPALFGCLAVCVLLFFVGRMTAPAAVAPQPVVVTRPQPLPVCPGTASPALTADAVRDIVREELGAHASPVVVPAPAPAAEPAREDDSGAVALEHARAVLTDRMADGHWTLEDREALRAAMVGLKPAQAKEILSTLFPAINAQKLVVETGDSPI